MKKLLYKSISLLVLVAFVFSCADDSLDPVQTKNVKKGTILALRGTQLDNLYNKGIPGAEVFPKIMTGAEKFSFDAEFLSENPNSLASVDVYVIQKVVGSAATNRLLMSNVPFSSFKTDGTYKGPWVSVSYTLSDVLAKLGLPVASDPIYKGNAGNPLLTTYQPGIAFEADLNLVDGSKVLASQLVAAGLYQSNQFYPAQFLSWTMTDYCAYDATSWSGAWFADEVGVGVSSPPGGDDLKPWVPVAPHTWQMNNFFGDGDGVHAVVIFTPSTDPSSQVVQYLNDTGKKYQTNEEGQISGTGTYNQCTQTFSINTTYTFSPANGGGTYKWIYNFHR